MNDIRTLDLNLLKALDVLLEECNVTRAAVRIGVTQPAMSGMLTRLRENFDDPLFVRAQRGMVPTPRALAIKLPLKQLLGEISGLLQPPAFDPASARLTFTLAATDYALRAVALPFLAALKPLAPQIQVALVAVDDRHIQAQLERGEIDVALVTRDSTPPDLHARDLFSERYVCVLREGHPALPPGDEALNLEQFCLLDHALVSYTGGGFHGVTDAALAQLGQQRRVTLSVNSFMILPEVLRASEMIAVLPARLVAGMPGLAVCEPPLAIPGFIKVAAWHPRTHHDPARRWLRQLLFSSCATQ